MRKRRLDSGQLGLGQGQEYLVLDAPGQRVGHHRQGHQVGRAGQQEASRPAIAVDRLLDGQQQARRALNLVDNHGPITADESHDGLIMAPYRLPGRK
jgi:hypothetical protein